MRNCLARAAVTAIDITVHVLEVTAAYIGYYGGVR